jgi:hypothetical protein
MAEPNLEKVANDGVSFIVTDEIREEPNVAHQLRDYVQLYLAPTKGEEEARDIHDICRRDILIVPGLVKTSAEQHQKALIAEVKKNPRKVAQKVREPYAVEAAEDFIGDDNYRALKDLIAEKEDVTLVFAQLHNDPLWREVVMRATQDARTGAATSHNIRVRKQELLNNLYITRGESTVYDSLKFATFMNKAANEANDDDAKNTVYQKVGIAYAKTDAANHTNNQRPSNQS